MNPTRITDLLETITTLNLAPDTGASGASPASPAPASDAQATLNASAAVTTDAAAAADPASPQTNPTPDVQSAYVDDASRLAAEAALQSRLDHYEQSIRELKAKLEAMPAQVPAKTPAAETDAADDPVAHEFNAIKGAIKDLTSAVQEIRTGWSKAVEDQNRALENHRLNGIRSQVKQIEIDHLKNTILKSDPYFAKQPDKGPAALLLSDVEAWMDGSFRPSLKPHEIQAQTAELRRLVADRIRQIKTLFPAPDPEPVRDQVQARDAASRNNLTAPAGGSPAPGGVKTAPEGSRQWWLEKMTEAARRKNMI